MYSIQSQGKVQDSELKVARTQLRLAEEKCQRYLREMDELETKLRLIELERCNYDRAMVEQVSSIIDSLEVMSTRQSGKLESRSFITWDEYFMSVAQLAGKRSKDPSTQVGACIVNGQNKIVATGYNGMPNGVSDDLVPWTKEGLFLETKYAYVVHAELNAILNCILTDQTGCRVYVSLFPCNECAKAIIQSGIRHVIYLSDKHKDKDSTKAAKKMFNLSGVRYESYSYLCARKSAQDSKQAKQFTSMSSCQASNQGGQ